MFVLENFRSLLGSVPSLGISFPITGARKGGGVPIPWRSWTYIVSARCWRSRSQWRVLSMPPHPWRWEGTSRLWSSFLTLTATIPLWEEHNTDSNRATLCNSLNQKLSASSDTKASLKSCHCGEKLGKIGQLHGLWCAGCAPATTTTKEAVGED